MRDDLQKKTVTQLRALAKELGVDAPARASKDVLVDAIVAFRGAQAARAAATRVRGKAAAPVAPPPAKAARGAKATAGKAKPAGTKSAKTDRTPGPVSSRRAASAASATSAASGAGAASTPPASAPRAAAPDSPGVVAAPSSPTLPDEYGGERLVLLARDPRWAFAYWELGERRAADVLARAGHDAHLSLRVYDLASDAAGAAGQGRSRDFPASGRVGRAHLELDGAGRTFVAEIGGLAGDGTFTPAARSEAIRMPRGAVSEIVDHAFRPAGVIAGAGEQPLGSSTALPRASSPGGPSSPGVSSPFGGPGR